MKTKPIYYHLLVGFSIFWIILGFIRIGQEFYSSGFSAGQKAGFEAGEKRMSAIWDMTLFQPQSLFSTPLLCGDKTLDECFHSYAPRPQATSTENDWQKLYVDGGLCCRWTEWGTFSTDNGAPTGSVKINLSNGDYWELMVYRKALPEATSTDGPSPEHPWCDNFPAHPCPEPTSTGKNFEPILEACVKDQIKKYGKWIYPCSPQGEISATRVCCPKYSPICADIDPLCDSAPAPIKTWSCTRWQEGSSSMWYSPESLGSFGITTTASQTPEFLGYSSCTEIKN